MERKAFLDQEPPPGYVAGLGRGATGFTTQADVGTGRIVPASFSDEESDDEDFVDDRFKDADETENGLNGFKEKDDSDNEADQVFAEIEERLKRRNKRKNEVQEDEEPLDEIKKNFQELKKNLTSISEEEWFNLPESGDLTRKNKRARLEEQQQQRFYAVPDSVINGVVADTMETSNSIDVTKISVAKDRLLGLRLDEQLDTEGNDVQEYLDSLKEQEDFSAKFGDINRARLILNSLRKTEPHRGSSWIASARLEEQSKNFSKAKELIMQGCKMCPRDENVWLERIRLNKTTDTTLCKIIVTEGLQYNVKSVKLWLQAIDLENESFSRKRILRKALENLPRSVPLWRRMIEEESSQEEKLKLLTKAVELIPDNSELCVDYIRMEQKHNLERAKLFLKDSLTKIPQSVDLTLLSCEIKEYEQNSGNEPTSTEILSIVFLDVLQSLKNQDKKLTFKEWLKYCEEYEKKGEYKNLVKVIIENTVTFGFEDVPEPELVATVNKIAYEYEGTELARLSSLIYYALTEKFPFNSSAWKSFINHDKSGIEDRFEKCLDKNPTWVEFWISYNSTLLKNGNIEKARDVLDRATKHNPRDPKLIVKSIEFCFNGPNRTESLELIEKGIAKFPELKIFYVYKIKISDALKISSNKLLQVCDDGISKHSKAEEMYLLKSEILIKGGDIDTARTTLEQGITNCSQSLSLRLKLCFLDEFKMRIITRARTVLELAVTEIKSDLTWFELIRFENRNRSKEDAQIVLSKALQKHPSSVLLLILRIQFEERASKRRNLYIEALKKTNEDKLLVSVIAHNLWRRDGKPEKAFKFFKQSLESSVENGDILSIYYNFIRKNGSPEQLQDFWTTVDKIDKDQLKKGYYWIQETQDLTPWKQTEEMIENTARKLDNDLIYV
ncbi:U4/U6-U5 snRNP complex splicing factor [Komagataella phaffii CBS 7435]|uniref:Splicing factor, component of the U4/U6-U5 snRNP complex n=2 Tax=Komagataella phaffii TaxID=460519 RepID=C4R873_KOMPG|nr:Splicing factor, component of the U4/U6-U5 snRNP complex [Komagataella phaffii GS115]AOA64737.1 GQ67_04908T0 [Komagataella phaffii]CAH2450809.1 Splicing factor [Komagataella phaffii CBS 7435]AOA69845.1 GQ68_04880T0 [Komagataella phaffii GS115]CAY71798.1 Splicing factor, component of the U4/U6-U5 snRNP complex [Komagataella phaffii GS115]CCA40603.1 U4/U6-U5 snRNP complex splicing factor [Komagataella phaffii CBS 7435]